MNSKYIFANIKKEGIVIKGQEPLSELEGKITGVFVNQKTFNNETYEELAIIIENPTGKYKVGVRLTSGFGMSLAKKLPNVKFDWPVRIAPHVEDNRTSVFVTQDNTQIKQKWTKNNPGNLPDRKYLGKANGKDVYDDSEQIAYLKAELEKVNPGKSASTPPPPQAPTPVVEDPTPIDDLPF